MGQPLIFGLLLVLGFRQTFEIANLEMDYQAYFYPGVVPNGVALCCNLFQHERH